MTTDIANVDYSTLDFSGSGPTDATAASPDSGDSTLTQLGGLFSSLGTTIAQDFSAISGPTTVKPGTVIVNPNGTTSVAGAFPVSGGSGLLIIGIGLLFLLFLLMRG